MLCDNCRSSNVANAKFCTVCGAPLQPQPSVRGQRQEPDSQPDNKFLYDDGFTTRQPPPEHHPQASGSRSTPRQQAVETPVRRSPGAVVCYLISGVLALVCAALPLLPQFWMWGVVGGKTYNVPEVAVILTGGGSVFEGGATNVTAGVLILVLFVLLLLFYLLWAVFSFVRIGAAGAVGLTGSILFAGAGLFDDRAGSGRDRFFLCAAFPARTCTLTRRLLYGESDTHNRIQGLFCGGAAAGKTGVYRDAGQCDLRLDGDFYSAVSRDGGRFSQPARGV